MAGRALGVHRSALRYEQLQEDHPFGRPFTPVQLLFPLPFCTCETFAFERHRGKRKRVNVARDAISH